MNAEVFAKGLEKCRLLTNLLGQNVENLDDYGCPKIQGLVTLSDTKQGFTVSRGKQKCMGNELCNICNFCTCLMYLCLLLIQFLQLDMIPFELERQMTSRN